MNRWSEFSRNARSMNPEDLNWTLAAALYTESFKFLIGSDVPVLPEDVRRPWINVEKKITHIWAFVSQELRTDGDERDEPICGETGRLGVARSVTITFSGCTSVMGASCVSDVRAVIKIVIRSVIDAVGAHAICRQPCLGVIFRNAATALRGERPEG